MPIPILGDVRIAFEHDTALPIAVVAGSGSAAMGMATTQPVGLVSDPHFHDVAHRPLPMFEALPIILVVGLVLARRAVRYYRRC